MLSSPRTWRALSRVHYWLSLLFGLQVLVWIATGLFFAAVPIERVRGEHLRQTIKAPISTQGLVAPELAAAAIGGGAAEMTLRQRDGAAVYVVTGLNGERTVVDARTGLALPALDADGAERAARAAYSGRGRVEAVRFHAVAPQETGRHGAIFAVTFSEPDAATLYVDPLTGEARLVRTDLWRAYDLLWGLHIMDWTGRQNFNSLHLVGFALGGLVLSVAGVGLAWARSRRRLIGRRGVLERRPRPNE